MLNNKIKEKIVLALDVETIEEAKELVEELKDYTGTFKVGLQLFMGYGLEIVNYILSKNANFFLDVKLHDIPNTVQKASENIVLRGANFFNVHCTGGLEMMRAARKGADDTAEKLNKKPPVILGVTMLTSISQEVMENEFKVDKNVSSFAISLAVGDMTPITGMPGNLSLSMVRQVALTVLHAMTIIFTPFDTRKSPIWAANCLMVSSLLEPYGVLAVSPKNMILSSGIRRII